MSEKVDVLPVSDFYEVLDSITIFKTEKWWKAIVAYKNKERKTLGLYLWQNKNGLWKRKHKYTIQNVDEWNKLKEAVDKLIQKI